MNGTWETQEVLFYPLKPRPRKRKGNCKFQGGKTNSRENIFGTLLK